MKLAKQSHLQALLASANLKKSVNCRQERLEENLEVEIEIEIEGVNRDKTRSRRWR